MSRPATTKTIRRKWVGHTPDMYWFGNLIDLNSIKGFNEGYRYILVSIDLYSRFAYMCTLEDKTTESCIEGFRYCFNIYDGRPTFLF